MKTKNKDMFAQNTIFLWIALMTGFLLSIPLIAMQFTNEVAWNSADFIVAGTLLFGMGSLFVLAARQVEDNFHRVVVGIIFAMALLYIWAELAVGIFTNWGS